MYLNSTEVINCQEVMKHWYSLNRPLNNVNMRDRLKLPAIVWHSSHWEVRSESPPVESERTLFWPIEYGASAVFVPVCRMDINRLAASTSINECLLWGKLAALYEMWLMRLPCHGKAQGSHNTERSPQIATTVGLSVHASGLWVKKSSYDSILTCHLTATPWETPSENHSVEPREQQRKITNYGFKPPNVLGKFIKSQLITGNKTHHLLSI